MSTPEKRRSRRIRIGQPLKIRASGLNDARIEENNITKNVSREGIYFVTGNAAYYVGMRLFVNVPHHTPSEPQDREYIGQVVRVDELPDGHWGVAIQFLSGHTPT